MVACISGYGYAVVLEWAPKMWESIKFEIWNGENEEFISSSLRVINALGKKLSINIQDWDDELNVVARFIIGILKECTEKILDSKQRFMLSTGRIIHAISCSSLFMFSWVPKKVLPSLLTLWDDLSLKSEKTSLLDVFNRGLQARNDVEAQLMVAFKSKILDQDTIKYCIEGGEKILKNLAPFKERLVEVYWSALTESATDSQDHPVFRINTIQGLASLMKFKEFLSDMERGTIIESLNGIVLAPNQRDDVLDSAVVALRTISMADPERFHTITLPNFMSKFADITDKEEIFRILDPLMQIACTSPCTFEVTSESDSKFMVFNAYQQCLLGLVSEAKLETQTSRVAYLLGAILRGMELFDAALKEDSAAAVSPSSTSHPYFFIVYGLFTKFVGVRGERTNAYVGLLIDLSKFNDAKEIIELHQVLSLLGDIATLALRSSQTTPENNFLIGPGYTGPSRIWTLFCDVGKELQGLGKSQMNVQNGPQDKCLVMVLSKSLAAGVRREVSTLSKCNKNHLLRCHRIRTDWDSTSERLQKL